MNLISFINKENTKNNTASIPATEGMPISFVDVYSALNMYNNDLIIVSDSGSYLEFNQEYVNELEDVYFSYAQSYYTSTNSIKATYINNTLSKISMNPILESAINEDVGTVTFGRPMFYFIKIDQLSGSIANTLKSHIFIAIEFAYSVQLSDFYNADTIDFIFQLPDGCIAVGLFPWIEYVETKEETTTRIPNISIDAIGFGAELGSTFERKTYGVYKYPVILPFGIYEQNFSWKIKDEAVREGPFILVPIIACPDSMEEIKINRLVAINYDRHDPFVPAHGPAFQKHEEFILVKR